MLLFFLGFFFFLSHSPSLAFFLFFLILSCFFLLSYVEKESIPITAEGRSLCRSLLLFLLIGSFSFFFFLFFVDFVEVIFFFSGFPVSGGEAPSPDTDYRKLLFDC